MIKPYVQHFKDLPDAQKVTFVQVPPADLTKLLPNLPPSTDPDRDACLCLIREMLVYPPEERLAAGEALKHRFFQRGVPLLLPAGYASEDTRSQSEVDGIHKSLVHALSKYLGSAS